MFSPIIVDNSDAVISFDTTRIFGPPSLTGTIRDVAVGKFFKGSADETTRIFTVMSALPGYALLINDTTHFPPLKRDSLGWQRHGANGRWIDSCAGISSGRFHGVAVGDINNDGVTDMIYARTGDPYMINRAWWNGSTWKTETLSKNLHSRRFVASILDIAVADADNDGLNDIIFPSGNALFRASWAGTDSFVIDSIWGGDGSICYGVAVGDFDSTHIGNEVVVVTGGGRVMKLSKAIIGWDTMTIFRSSNDSFFDVAVGDFEKDHYRDEICVNNGYNYSTQGNIFIFRGKGTEWSLAQLACYNTAWQGRGEITVGNVYDMHDGNEIVAVAGGTSANNYPVVVWKTGANWYYKFLPSTGGTTYGVAVGNVNRYRPPSGVPNTDEIVITGNRSVYEYEQRTMFNNDVAVTAVNLLPSLVTVHDSVTVGLHIINLGYYTQDTIPVFYKTLDKATVSETCYINLAYGDTVNFVFRHKYYPSSAGNKAIRCSLGLRDEQYPSDDTMTVVISIYNTLAGNFSVGVDGDYIRITDALASWKNSVIIGDVMFSLLDTAYPSEIYPLVCSLPVAYQNSNWSLTIRPEGAMPLIQSSNSTAIFDIKAVARLRIDSIVIINNASSAPAIRFINGACNNTIRKCNLKAANTSTGAIYFSIGGNNGNVISECDIHSSTVAPAYGVYFNGSANPNENRYDSIIGCRIYDFSSCGIYLVNNALYTVIDGNEIFTLTQQASSTLQGIALGAATVGGTQILRNTIRDFWTSYATPTFRGIHLYFGSTTRVTRIINNFISIDAIRNHRTATIYGICEASGVGYLFDIYDNTIYIGGTDTMSFNSYGFYRGYQSIINLKNNIIFNNRINSAGTGKHCAIYCANTGAGLVSNYNDFYAPNDSGYVGYWGGVLCKNLIAWRTASSQDANSINKTPDFQSASNLHINPNSINVDRKGVPISGINNDIDNDYRHPVHPDIGADEYLPNPPGNFSLISPDSSSTWQRLDGNLMWHKATTAEFYDVYLDTINPPNKKVSALQADTFYHYSHLLQTRNYFWQIVAWNDTNPAIARKGGAGPTDAATVSSIWLFQTATLPTPPSNLILSNVSTSSMKLSWRDNSSDETGFYIRFDTTTVNEFPLIDSVSANETTYTVNNLIPGAHYWWRVSAFDQYGETDFTQRDTSTLAETPGLPYLSNMSYTALKVKLEPKSNSTQVQYLIRILIGSVVNKPAVYREPRTVNRVPQNSGQRTADNGDDTKYLHPNGVLVDTAVWATYAQFGGASGKSVNGLMPNMVYTFDAKARNNNRIETGYGPSATQTTLPAITLPFAESFDSTTFPPFGWTEQVIASGGSNWTRVSAGTNPTQAPYHGAGEAQYNSDYPVIGANARLVLPPIDFTDVAQAQLKFYMYHDNAAGDDSILIETSGDNGLTWQRHNKIIRYQPTNGWQAHIISLDNSIGNTAMIAFHAFNDNGNNIFVDSVAVYSVSDVMISAISRPAQTEWKRVGFTPQVTVVNNSTQAESVPVTAEIYKPGSGFADGFEGGNFPPTGWAIYNNDGGGAKWQKNTITPMSGTTCAACASEIPGLRNDDWLVTRQIAVPVNGELHFWYKTSVAGNDSIEIWLSNTSNAISDFTIRRDAFGIRNTAYSEKIISLSGYANQNIYIAFVNKGLNQGTIYLDDVSVNFNAPSLVYQDFDTVLVANGRAAAQVYFKPCTLMVDGNYQFKSYTTLPDDGNPYNNMMIKDFIVQPITLTLLSPVDEFLTNNNAPLFDWIDIAGANQYRIQVADNINFNTPVIDELTTISQWQVLAGNELADGLYYWHARVEQPSPADPYSSNWTLTIDTQGPNAPILVLPADNQHSNNPRPVFVWHRVGDATQYNLLVTSAKTDAVNIVTTDTSYTPSDSLSEGHYTWQTRGRDAAGNWGDFSDARTYSVDITPPAVPILISPADSAVVTSRVSHFVWHSATGAANYEVNVRYNKDSIVTDTACNFELNRGNFHWRVKAKDSVGNWSDWSSEMVFFVNLEWVRKHDILTLTGKNVKDGGSLVAADTVLYAFRGYKSNEFYKYSIASDQWQRKESIPYGYKQYDPTRINKKRIGKGAALVWNGDNIIYAMKGNNTTELWAYNITQGTWTAKQFVQSAKGLKGGSSLVYYDGLIFLLAGGQPVTADNFFVYQVATNSWSPDGKALLTPDGKAYKDGSCLALFGDTIFALKGNGKHNYFYAYNININSWSERETIPLIHPLLGKHKYKVKDGAAITSGNGIIYAIKGGGKQEFWQYTPGGAGWEALETIPRVVDKKSVPKTGAAMAFANNSIYLLKGNNKLEFWQYVPSSVKSEERRAKSTEQIANNAEQTAEQLSAQCPLLNAQIAANPNPFSKQTTIQYTVPVAGKVMIKLYSTTGKLVETFADEYHNAGLYTLEIGNWKLEIPQGIYFLKYSDATNSSELKLIVQ